MPPTDMMLYLRPQLVCLILLAAGYLCAVTVPGYICICMRARSSESFNSMYKPTDLAQVAHSLMDHLLL